MCRNNFRTFSLAHFANYTIPSTTRDIIKSEGRAVFLFDLPRRTLFAGNALVVIDGTAADGVAPDAEFPVSRRLKRGVGFFFKICFNTTVIVDNDDADDDDGGHAVISTIELIVIYDGPGRLIGVTRTIEIHANDDARRT